MKNIILLALLAIGNAFGQQNNLEKPVYTIPTVASPDSYQFSKISNIFESSSSGAFTYNYPLASLSINNFNLNINANYYTTGLKVDELAGYIGANWTLSYGGIVTRIVNGTPDENVSERWQPNNIITTNENDYNKIIESGITPRTLAYDSENDIFSFVINGKSGKFYYPTGTVNDRVNINQIISNEGYKISFEKIRSSNGEVFSEIIIIDNNGDKYIFGGESNFIEFNIKDSDCNTNTPVKEEAITSWFLKKIITSNNQIINFTYSENTYLYISGVNQDITFKEKSKCFNDNTFNKVYQPELTQCLSYNNINSKYLKKIESENQEILFNYSTNRKDELKYELNNIEIYNKFDKSKFIKKLTFEYNLINLNISHNYPRLTGNPHLKYRIFLKSISEIDNKNNLTNKTSFEYNNLDNLPIRLSFSQDKYGFYNKNKNNYLFDNTFTSNSELNQIISSYGYNEFFKNNLSSNDNAINGTLKKVIHPTKGETYIEYEPNYYLATETKIIPNSESFKILKECDVYDYESYKVFTFTSNGSPLSFRVGSKMLEDDDSCPNYGLDSTHDKYSIEVINLTKNQTVFTHSALYGSFNNNTPSCTNTGSIINSTCTTTGDKYQVTMRVLGKKFRKAEGNFTIFYNEYLENQLVEKRGPGLRVKKIFNLDTNLKEYNKKEFYYNTLEKYKDNSKESSINTFKNGSSYSRFSIKRDSYMECNCYNYTDLTDYNRCFSFSQVENSRLKDVIKFNSGTNQTYYSNLGQEVFYNNILTINKDKDSENYIQSDYNYREDQDGHYIQGTPTFYAPKSNNSFLLNGTFDKVSFYNSSKVKIKEEEYKYLFPELSFGFNYNYFFNKNYNLPGGIAISVNNWLENFSIYQYRMYYGTIRKQKQITKEYLSGGTVTTETNYVYDGVKHNQLTEESTTNSKGEVLKKTYKYVPDYNAASTTILGKMEAKNMIVPIETKTFNGSTQISHQKTDYYEPYTGIFLPQYVYTKKGGNTTVADRKITYNSYDEKGNLTQYTLENGIPVAIIWGYGGQYPVAKIEGSTFANATSKLANYLTKIQNGTLTVAEQSTIRTLIPDAMLTSYTYQPLVGVTSIMQPNGQTEYYNYDSSNRLQSIVNDKKEVLKTFEYNYKQP